MNIFRRSFDQRSKILFFLQLPQDLDLFIPLIKEAQKSFALNFEVAVLDYAIRKSPRVPSLLKQHQIKFFRVAKAAVLAGFQPSLSRIRALVTASESTAPAHQAAHALTRRANQAGILTYTLQHGFDNIGLTYEDDVHPIEQIRFASQKVLIWGTLDSLHPNVIDETLHKCTSVGATKQLEKASLIELPKLNKPLIAVFENLHWHRYSASYRQRFLEDIEKVAQTFPLATFLIKPHHAGQWLTRRYKGKLPSAPNLIIADPSQKHWEPYTAPTLLPQVDIVITTPSTVAIDAALAERPTAVIGYELELGRYQPLPILQSQQDWVEFLRAAQHSLDREQLIGGVKQFLQKNLISINAEAKIVALIANNIV